DSRVVRDAADAVQPARFARKVADAGIDDQRPPAGGKALLEAAVVMVDGADVVVQDRLVPRSAYLQEYVQRLLVGVERVPVTAGVQVNPAQVVEGLRLPAPVAGLAV